MIINEITFETGGPELIDELEPVWLALFDHHEAVGGGGLPVISRDQSWPRRRALYLELLASPGAFVIAARHHGQIVGYALARIHCGADDTWPTGDAIGEIETLATLPGYRGQGLGTTLLDAAEQRLAESGASDVLISVLNGNDDAIRFYARRGMTPVITTFLRLGRHRPGI